MTVLEEEKGVRGYYTRRDCMPVISLDSEAIRVMEISENIILVLNGRDLAGELDIFHFKYITRKMDPKQIW